MELENKFERSKIYRVKSENSSKTYIGSTINPLEVRHKQHIYEYKRHLRNNTKESKVIEVMKHGNYCIELVEDYPCGSKDELRNREGYWQLMEGENCVNKALASVGGRKKAKYECGCGSIVGWYNRIQHFKTEKHNKWVK